MAIQGVETKCYILALFVRDDDERFLLGSGHYEFKDSQKQFSANTIQNDVVEVQGNDGFLLAGQVRRPGTQSFDGYIGDGTTEKTEVEEYRRQFFGFFRKNHFYRVIYVFPDGSAIQRKRGFLVDDATVQELYQQYPEYHVALNFEDVNYYSYSENEQGEEIYAEEAQIDLSSMLATGGLVWDEYGAVNQGYAWGGETTVAGTEFTVQNDLSLPAPITDTRLNGNTYQQTYSGKNLLKLEAAAVTRNGITFTPHSDGSFDISGTATANTEFKSGVMPLSTSGIVGGQSYTISSTAPINSNNLVYYVHSCNENGGWAKTLLSFTSSATRTAETPSTDYVYFVVRVNNGKTVNLTNVQTQIETGITATDFEPYVGGTASPNPDYPQEIQTVTGEQTVSVSGKNLFNPDSPITSQISNVTVTKTALENGIRLTATTVPSNANNYAGAVFIIGEVADYIGKTIRFSSTAIPSSSKTRCYIGTCNSSGGSRSSKISGGGVSGTYNYDLSWTVTSDSNQYICIVLYEAIGDTITVGDYVDFTDAQVEVGSTTTAYVPYQTPQSYTVDLGSTELCKIGDYQDYIYKGADGWYLHKEIGKVVFTGTENWSLAATYTNNKRFVCNDIITSSASNTVLSDYFTQGVGGSDTENVAINNSDRKIMLTISNSTVSNLADFKTWLGSHNTTVYYILATPTDTKITDTTLVSQLDALGSAKLMVGENNVLVSATGTNLLAELQIKYYSTVSFDGAGFVWEEGGSGGPTTVQIDSITNVYPIWKVKGPAVNPELSVITTNTTLKYEGSVGANQTLVIDMMNKTAKINGTSVIGNVTGDWVNFTPGINRVVYITDNADTPPSLIEWQEVVG